MRIAPIYGLLAMLLVGGSAAAAADQDPHQHGATPQAQAAPAAQGAPGRSPGMMGHGMMDMGAMHCLAFSDQRLASLKAEFAVTGAQQPLWNAFVEAVRANVRSLSQGMAGMGMGQGPAGQSGSSMMASAPLPERLERHERMMTAHLDALRRVRTSLAPLYASFTAEQKAKADRLMCGPMR